jgi:hypothetical protein
VYWQSRRVTPVRPVQPLSFLLSGCGYWPAGRTNRIGATFGSVFVAWAQFPLIRAVFDFIGGCEQGLHNLRLSSPTLPRRAGRGCRPIFAFALRSTACTRRKYTWSERTRHQRQRARGSTVTLQRIWKTPKRLGVEDPPSGDCPSSVERGMPRAVDEDQSPLVNFALR